MVTNLVPLLPWQCHRGVQWPSTVKRKTDEIKPGIDYKQLQTSTSQSKSIHRCTASFQWLILSISNSALSLLRLISTGIYCRLASEKRQNKKAIQTGPKVQNCFQENCQSRLCLLQVCQSLPAYKSRMQTMYSHGIASAHWPPEPGWNGSIRTTLSTTGQKRHKTFQMFASFEKRVARVLGGGAQTPTSRTKSPGEFRWCSSCAENTKCPSAWNVTQFAVFIVGFMTTWLHWPQSKLLDYK